MKLNSNEILCPFNIGNTMLKIPCSVKMEKNPRDYTKSDLDLLDEEKRGIQSAMDLVKTREGKVDKKTFGNIIKAYNRALLEIKDRIKVAK